MSGKQLDLFGVVWPATYACDNGMGCCEGCHNSSLGVSGSFGEFTCCSHRDKTEVVRIRNKRTGSVSFAISPSGVTGSVKDMI